MEVRRANKNWMFVHPDWLDHLVSTIQKGNKVMNTHYTVLQVQRHLVSTIQKGNKVMNTHYTVLQVHS